MNLGYLWNLEIDQIRVCNHKVQIIHILFKISTFLVIKDMGLDILNCIPRYDLLKCIPRSSFSSFAIWDFLKLYQDALFLSIPSFLKCIPRGDFLRLSWDADFLNLSPDVMYWTVSPDLIFLKLSPDIIFWSIFQMSFPSVYF